MGERNSGTNLLQELIRYNYDVPVEWPYGWKHWPDIISAQNADRDDVLIVIISRNVNDWANSFKKTMHQVPIGVKNIPFKNFLQVDWQSYSQSDNKVLDNPSTLMQKRNLFYSSLRDLDVKNKFFVTYEELCNSQENVLNRLSSVLNCQHKRVPVLTKINPGLVDTKQPYKKSNNVLTRIERDILHKQRNQQLERFLRHS
jgi:hypothetical protein